MRAESPRARAGATEASPFAGVLRAYDVARETYGAEAAKQLWQRTEAALDRLEASAGDAFRHTGSLRLAADDEERDEIRLEYEALREDGFAAEWRDEVPHLRPEFRGAIFHPPDGSLQPGRFVRQLAEQAAAEGVSFRQHHRVESLDELGAGQIVIATDGSGRGLLAELDDAIWPARGQVITTEPLSERLFDCPHYARNGFDYWQQLTDGRIVLGGFRDFSILTGMTDEETTTEPIQEALDAFLVDSLGYMPEVTPLGGNLRPDPGSAATRWTRSRSRRNVDRRCVFGPRECPGLHVRRARRRGRNGSRGCAPRPLHSRTSTRLRLICHLSVENVPQDGRSGS